MLRKLLLLVLLSVWLAIPSVSFAGGGCDDQQQIHLPNEKEDDMSPEMLAALIIGGSVLAGVVLTAKWTQ